MNEMTNDKLIKLIKDNQTIKHIKCNVAEFSCDKIVINIDIMIFSPFISLDGEILSDKYNEIRYGLSLEIPRSKLFILNSMSELPRMKLGGDAAAFVEWLGPQGDCLHVQGFEGGHPYDRVVTPTDALTDFLATLSDTDMVTDS